MTFRNGPFHARLSSFPWPPIVASHSVKADLPSPAWPLGARAARTSRSIVPVADHPGRVVDRRLIGRAISYDRCSASMACGIASGLLVLPRPTRAAAPPTPHKGSRPRVLFALEIEAQLGGAIAIDLERERKIRVEEKPFARYSELYRGIGRCHVLLRAVCLDCFRPNRACRLPLPALLAR
jgi:hypothetical protein